MRAYWFRSRRFGIEPGEDRPLSPGVYGRQLAHWLREGLVGRGYRHAQVRQEDWGWCVIARQRPHLLWIGCGSVEEDNPTAPATRLWHCHAALERSWLTFWLDRAAADAALAELDLVLRGLLLAEPDIQQVDPP